MTTSLTVGILGAGQLGRMLALAGYPLGLRFRFFDTTPEAPAGQLAPLTVGDFADLPALSAWARGVDVITYEFENVPVGAAEHLSARAPVFPPPRALREAQDRLPEKTLFRALGLPTPQFHAVDTPADLTAAAAQLGYPLVLKTRRLGYDGKGQQVIASPADLPAVGEALGVGRTPLIAEAFVPFERELSSIAARGRDGRTVCYPLTENQHRGGILRVSYAPAPAVSPALQAQAEDYINRVLTELDYVGVLAIEWFVQSGQLLANEMAPRVHNSGHWTQDGAVTSQFENHLRAILGWPLGDPAPRAPTAMLNCIGALPNPADIAAQPGARLHLYGKSPRPGRKVGHVNVCAPDWETLHARVRATQALIPEA